MFHSGVFTWLGVYFEQRYAVGPVGVGLALLGYGVPGFLFGPLIGRAADRWGRARLLPIGLGLSAVAAALLILGFPVILAPAVAMVLSLGYDMTQPLFGGIVTSLGDKRPGQAMGLNVFMLFVGFGLIGRPHWLNEKSVARLSCRPKRPPQKGAHDPLKSVLTIRQNAQPGQAGAAGSVKALADRALAKLPREQLPVRHADAVVQTWNFTNVAQGPSPG